jgi:hypothetical protein
MTASATTAPDVEGLRCCLDGAIKEHFEASVTPRFPVNYAFSTCGTEHCVHSAQAWFEADPEPPKISDDKMVMYNSIDRTAIFAALRERPEFRSYIPFYRMLYGQQARIFLA